MNRKAVSIFTFQRILVGSLVAGTVPGDWPVWPSDLGHELIMRKVGPFPTCCSPFWRLYLNDLRLNSSFEV